MITLRHLGKQRGCPYLARVLDLRETFGLGKTPLELPDICMHFDKTKLHTLRNLDVETIV